MRTFGYAKIISEKFAVTYSFNSSERLSTDTERQHGGKIQRHFAHNSEVRNEIQQ